MPNRVIYTKLCWNPKQEEDSKVVRATYCIHLLSETVQSVKAIKMYCSCAPMGRLKRKSMSGDRGNGFGYVLIPKSAQAGKLDYSDYEAVKAFYNLPD